MDITNDRFPTEVFRIIQDILDSHFVAFDLELSGIPDRKVRATPGKPSLQEIYEEVRTAAQSYQVLQVGLTVVKEDRKTNGYILHPYNFMISPLPQFRERQFRRAWSMHSGAVDFLLRNHFDFGRCLTHGIHYLTQAEETQVRSNLMGEDTIKRPDMILKAEDDKLVNHVRTSVHSWLSESELNREDYLNIPNDSRGKGVPGILNRYQVRLVHQVIQNEFPGMQTTTMAQFVQVTNPSPEEASRRREAAARKIERDVAKGVGFRWILDALCGQDVSGLPEEYLLSALTQDDQSHATGQGLVEALIQMLARRPGNRKRILVGHNCFTDLVFLHQFITGVLPPKVEEFQDSIKELFPAIVDTKYLASLGSARWSDTSLAKVEEGLRAEELPVISVPGEFDRYQSGDWEHEAGFDSLLTAKVMIKQSVKVYTDQSELVRTAISSVRDLGSAGFGDHDGYVSAAESVGSRYASDEEEEYHSEIAEPKGVKEKTVSTNRSTRQNSSPASTVGKGVTKAVHNAADTIRSAFASTTIFETLTGKAADEDAGRRKIETVGSRDKQRSNDSIKISHAVGKGSLMPRWDDEDRFWHKLGNRLQVNSCREGTFEL